MEDTMTCWRESQIRRIGEADKMRCKQKRPEKEALSGTPCDRGRYGDGYPRGRICHHIRHIPPLCTTYVDANLYYCMLTGKSVSGVLRLFNKHSCRLVYEEARHIRDSYLWFQVSCCKNSNQTNHQQSPFVKVSWDPC
jgi:hypothetical protein